jgi:hypothetical protein
MENFKAFSKLGAAYFITGERIKELEADIFTMGFLKGMEDAIASRQRELVSLKNVHNALFIISCGYTINQCHCDQLLASNQYAAFADFIQSRCSSQPSQFDLPFMQAMWQSQLNSWFGRPGSLPPWKS